MVKMTTTKKKTKKARNGRPTLGTEDVFYKLGGNPLRGEHGWLEYHAKQPLDLPVKQKHIDEGEPKSPTECILALAGYDYFDGKFVIEVGCTLFRVIDDKKKKRLTWKIGSAMQRRLKPFDKMSFWDLPPALYRLSPMPRKKKKRAANATKSHDNHVQNNQLVIGARLQVKRKKKISSPTRIISRGKILSTPSVGKSMLKKKK